MTPRRWLVVLALAAALLLLAAPVVKLMTTKAEEKRLAGLLPEVRAALEELRRRLAARGVQTYVGSTLRSDADQAAILERGTSTTSNSWHLLGRAVDLYPYDPLTNRPDLAGHNVDLFRQMHREAELLGFHGLAFNSDGSKRLLTNAAGKKFWDGGHLEFRAGMSFAVAREDYRRRKAAQA